MYSLILTGVVWLSSYGTAATSSVVPGFHSEAACMAAGNAYIQNNRAYMYRVTALCVRMGSGQY